MLLFFVFAFSLSHLRCQVSLRLGHTRGKTTLSCFLTLSRHYVTSAGRLSSPSAELTPSRCGSVSSRLLPGGSCRACARLRENAKTKNNSKLQCTALSFHHPREPQKLSSSLRGTPAVVPLPPQGGYHAVSLPSGEGYQPTEWISSRSDFIQALLGFHPSLTDFISIALSFHHPLDEGADFIVTPHPPQAVPRSRCGSVTLEGKQHLVVF